MSRLKLPFSISNVKNFEELRKYTAISLKDIIELLNGKVTPLDNMDVSFVSVTFAAANTNIEVAHTLTRLPVGYIVVGRSAAITVFDGTIASTETSISFRSSGTGTATILVF